MAWQAKCESCFQANVLIFTFIGFALFTAPDGITDFGIAQAKHCNLVFCSFVLRID